MQEKLARLHFSLDVCGEEEDEEEEDGVTEGLPEEQKKTMADRNLDQLLSNVGLEEAGCFGSWGTWGGRRYIFPKPFLASAEKVGLHGSKSCEPLSPKPQSKGVQSGPPTHRNLPFFLLTA